MVLFSVDKVVEELIIIIENIKGMDDFQITKEQATEEGLPCVQLMRYDIALLAKNGYEDSISLILGLSDTDERIEMAIEELMEGKTLY